MFKVANHSLFAHPLPQGHRFPMLKYELIPSQLCHEGILCYNDFFQPELVDEKWILKAHDMVYWTKLKELSLTPLEVRRIGFPLSDQLVERECRIAQGTIQGAVSALEDKVAFNIAGGTHHAGRDWGEGFCLLNDQAIAAYYLLENRLAKRIVIIDLDVHQGNGTAQIFENEPQVFTFSMHAAANFPFRKEISDKDIGLPLATSDREYLGILEENLEYLFHEIKPDFVFYQAGVDVLSSDKLGKLDLSLEACKSRDALVLNYCKRHQVPVQISMGGGYSADIKIIVEAHCNTYRLAKDMFY
ncbi:MAG: histone deacetylase [Pedobacter sp.]|nr:MAG: histone deacetylase [Pedobacter sp.]